ncbi:MAG: cupin domain-containing protein [Chloroflexi bacterium]|nr:cupin domain-containing protein [Chloroflexota bacterium]MBV9132667.1 cupin domain-containing protein [Chloroflexota bacterium]MBV9896427.1 cupin domain-containing protein [Chloroflexota bacterium]
MPGKVRRIVTGVNDAGRSFILSDTRLPTADVSPGQPVSAGLWITDRSPASNAGNNDPVADGTIATIPPADRGGSIFRIIDFSPDSQTHRPPEEMERRGAKISRERWAKLPGFHQTDTVDYAIVLEGEVYAVLDEGETLMRAGDVLIQRGTHHAWSNRSGKLCRMAFILIDAEPLPNH